MKRIVVIGGGAAGCAAAIMASRDENSQIIVLERQARTGRKLLSTGNGRCNLSNVNALPAAYMSVEGGEDSGQWSAVSGQRDGADDRHPVGANCVRPQDGTLWAESDHPSLRTIPQDGVAIRPLSQETGNSDQRSVVSGQRDGADDRYPVGANCVRPKDGKDERRQAQRTGETDCHTSDVGHWFAMTEQSTDERTMRDQTAAAFTKAALSRFSAAETLEFFHSLGLLTVTEPTGRVYPLSDQSNSVVDLLRFALDRPNIQLHTGRPALGVARKNGKFVVKTETGNLLCDRLIIACGGAAGAKVGGVSDGYALLESLGHSRTALYPALSPLKTEAAYARALKGVRADAAVYLVEGAAWEKETPGRTQFAPTTETASPVGANCVRPQDDADDRHPVGANCVRPQDGADECRQAQRTGDADCHASEVGHWLAMTEQGTDERAMRAPTMEPGASKAPEKSPLSQRGWRKAPGDLSAEPAAGVLAASTGEVQFTEYGLSGPAIFDISRAAAQAPAGAVIVLDLLREYTEKEILALLQRRRAAFPALTTDDLLTGLLHNRLGRMVCKYAGLTGGAELSGLTDGELIKTARACKSFVFPLLSALGFESAQITAGGMRLSEFEPETLESRLVPGLFACGEVLDVDGPCGGYNLQWAWSSGRLAGSASVL